MMTKQNEGFEVAPGITAIPYGHTIDCKIVSWLPYERTYDACDINTREKVQICSGEFIHCIYVATTLCTSQEMYNKMKAGYVNELRVYTQNELNG